jgi:hypothetical protein
VAGRLEARPAAGSDLQESAPPAEAVAPKVKEAAILVKGVSRSVPVVEAWVESSVAPGVARCPQAFAVHPEWVSAFGRVRQPSEAWESLAGEVQKSPE